MLERRHALCILLGVAAVAGCNSGRQIEDVAGYRAELASISDRGVLKKEIIDNANQMVGDKEADAALWARLNLIRERVDQLDGLIHVSTLADGSKLKFYEREPGKVSVAFLGANPSSDSSMMDGDEVTAIEVFKRAEPGKAVPQALLDADARAAENGLPMLTPAEQAADAQKLGLPAAAATEARNGTITQHHEVANHGTMSVYQWQQHCGAGNYQDCLGGGMGTVTHRYPQQVRGVDWLYMLNSRTGSGLGELLVANWDVYDNASFFSASYGPWFSGVGQMVKWRTTGRVYTWQDGSLCGLFACVVYSPNYVAVHDITMTAGPNNQWHLAGKGIAGNNYYAISPGTGNIPLP